MKKVLGFAAVALTLVACAAAPATEGPAAGAAPDTDLEGRAISVVDGETSSTQQATKSRVVVDGEAIDVAFDGTSLRVTSAARTLVLSAPKPGLVGVDYDDPEHGEHVVSQVPALEATSASALAARRGHVAKSELKRFGIVAPAAAHAIASWSGARKDAADALLASWISSMTTTEAAATTGQAEPRMVAFEEESGGCPSACSVSVQGYSCSATCKQGVGNGCAYCFTYPNSVSCGCF